MHGKRNFGLDLARASAITAVYLSHGVTALHTLGIGVDLFFVLSGFLIGRIYFRDHADGDFKLFRFWQARWGRTLPPYLAALGLFALFSLRFPGNPVHLYYVVFLQNYLGMTGFGPSWSLCVEEHFYLALPLLAWAAERVFGLRAFLWLLPAAALVPQCLRTYYLVWGGGLPANWYWMSHFHCEGLILGVLLAFLFVHHRPIWDKMRPLALVLAPIPVLLLVGLKIHPTETMTLHGAIFLYYALGFTGWVRCLYDLKWNPAGAAARLVKSAVHGLALASYSIYLVHVLLFTDIRLLIDGWPRGPVKSGFILATTFLGGVVFYWLVERPTITLRDRYFKRHPVVVKAAPRAAAETV